MAHSNITSDNNLLPIAATDNYLLSKMNGWPYVGLVASIRSAPLLAFLLFGLGCAQVKPSTTADGAKSERPNVLLLVIDDLGYADLAPFGATNAEAPTKNLAALVARGTAYTQAYVSAPVCSPSRVGLLTGMNQFRWDKPASWGPGLPDSVRTIAEVLREAGYATARIGKNDLGRNFHQHAPREYPLRHGYDEFLGFSAHAHDYWHLSDSIRALTPDPKGTSAVLGPLMHNEGEKSYEDGYLTDILTNEAIDYLGRERSEPFFLTLAYASVHHLIHEVPRKYLDRYGVSEIANYDPSDTLSFRKHPAGSYSAYYDKYSRTGDISPEEMRGYYLANLHCLDDNVGRLTSALNDLGLNRNTMIILISDNGGSPLTGADNAPLTGGKYSLWEGGIRVPMSVSLPGTFSAGATENGPVSALDLFPTILRTCVSAQTNGGNPQTSVTSPYLDGRDLNDPDPERLLVWKWQKTWAVRRGRYKLTNAHDNHWKSAPTEQYLAPIVDNVELKLFDLVADPGERNDLANLNLEIVSELKVAYEAYVARAVGRY